MALFDVMDVAERTASERKGRTNSKPWKRIHYVTFTEVVDQKAADVAGDKVEEQWYHVKQMFGEPAVIQQALIALASGKAKTWKFNNDCFITMLTSNDLKELAMLKAERK